jgi:cellulose synthase/poly-beta-1,6-N-acetylglucosamine synthase-like glycosyltransferase
MITLLFSILLLSGALLYLLFTAWIFRGLGKLKKAEIKVEEKLPTVSVIVPARNEDHNIEETLESLAGQNYPQEKLQVVMVNDRSTDNTPGIMARYAHTHKNFTLVEIDILTPGISPKKNAIEWGISASTGEIIFTTDADCIHSSNWIRQIVSYFTSEVGLVAGLSVMEPDDETIFHRLHALDYLSHSFVGAGAIGNSSALNCTGANLAYRYEAFTQLCGFGKAAHFVSGDDEFFLQKLVNSKKWKAAFALGAETIVRSLPPENLIDIIYQRFRWGSKGLYYPQNIKKLALGIFIFFIILMTAPFLTLVNFLPLMVFMLALSAKLLSDLMVMRRGCRVFQLKFPWFSFFALFIIHPLLIVLSALGGHFLHFKWKGEPFRSKV